MSPATIRDVAKEAGVSIGTVSRVLNNHPAVREVTRRRVEEVIAHLDYSPNSSARSLSLGKTLTIAAIVPYFTRPSFVERLRGVETVMAESQYDLVLFNVETPEKRREYFRELPRRERFDGLLIFSMAPSDSEVAYFQQTGIPIVLVDCFHPALNRIYVDDVQGGCMAVQHLIDLGHRRIGFVGDWIENPFNFTSSKYRLQGYTKALQAAGIPFCQAYVREDDHGVRQAQRMAHELLALAQPPTAIFAASDTQAIGVLRAAQERGLEVPEDISVIGYDDIDSAEYLHLSTIHQPLFESGVEGTELLLRAMTSEMQQRSEATGRQLPLELVARRTTAPVVSDQ